MKQPLVSVLLPAYNAEKTIKPAIDSILNQTYSNLELICIDDGSTDNTLNQLKEYQDKRLILITRENRGLIKTLNEAIELASGQFLARMDADDISHKNRIEKQVAHLMQHPDIVALGSSIIEFDENGIICKSTKAKDHDTLLFGSLHSTPLCHPTALIRANIVREHCIRYDSNYPHAEDVKLWFDLSRHGNLSNLPDALLDYRRSNTQISNLHKSTQKESALKCRKHIYKHICTNYGIDFSQPTSQILDKLPNQYEALYNFLRFTTLNTLKLNRIKLLTLIYRSSLKLSDKTRLATKLIKENFK